MTVYLYVVEYKSKGEVDERFLDLIEEVGVDVENQINKFIPENLEECLTDEVRETYKDLIPKLKELEGKEVALCW